MKKTKKDVYQDKITNVFKSDLVANAKFSKNYELPIIKRVDYKPEKAIAFCEVGSKKIIPEETWVHFYMHDYKFERVWNNPKKYLPILKKFKGVITTDFSLYREMPIAMQIWNTYRNRALAYYLQSNGINIIYNVRFGDERTYDFVFEGLPKGGTYAVGSNGCISSKIDREYFKKGLEYLVKTLEPKTIINYYSQPDDIFKEYIDQGIEVISLPNWRKQCQEESATNKCGQIRIEDVFVFCKDKTTGGN